MLEARMSTASITIHKSDLLATLLLFIHSLYLISCNADLSIARDIYKSSFSTT